jgi:hypothetical protein
VFSRYEIKEISYYGIVILAVIMRLSEISG